MKRPSLNIALIVLTLAGICFATDAQRTDLNGSEASFTVTIQEHAGIERRAEPTQVSLPFAAGRLPDAKDVAIINSNGISIPAQFEVLARWKDDTVRWLLARFLADVPAQGKVTLSVRQGAAASMVQGNVKLVRREGQVFIADTGPIQVQVGADQRGGFGVTDHQGNALLKQRPELMVYSPTGGQYRSGPPEQVELEVNGPLYASIFLAGPMQAKDSRYDGVLHWETRLHLWKGLARILAEHTVVAMGAAENGITIIDGIVVDLKAVGGFSHYVVAGNDRTHAGKLKTDDAVRLKQTCAYWHETVGSTVVVLESDFGYELSDMASGVLAAGEKSAGWLWSAGVKRSIGVAVRDFWEEGPKALKAGADGTVGIECYAHWQPEPGEPRPVRRPTPDYSQHPRKDAWAPHKDPEAGIKRWLQDTGYGGPVRRGPFRFGQGRAKTTDVLYLFGQANNQEAEIDTLAARRDQLIPVVEPRYLAATRAFPYVALAACGSGLPELEKVLLGMLERRTKYFRRYGFLHFGDGQCGWGYNRTVPSTTDDQEYDTTHAMTMQFARTGNPAYLRAANICARHFIDVDQIHITGQLGYQDNTARVSLVRQEHQIHTNGQLHFHGYGSGGDYHEESRGIDMGGHPYIAGIVNHYMLTGDRRSLRGIYWVAKALRDYGSNARDSILNLDGRSIARPGICLAAIYDLTKDSEHLTPVKRLVDVINDMAGDVTNDLRGEGPFRTWWINHSEMSHHVRELLMRYHAATGDPRTLKTLTQALDLYIDQLWDSQKMAWRGWGGAPFDFNMPYERALTREPRRGRATDMQTRLIGIAFAYIAMVTGNDGYLAPFLDSLDNIGPDLRNDFGHDSRYFSEHQLWCLPFVSMLPAQWRSRRDEIVQREVFRASLKKEDGLVAWTPQGQVKGTSYGQILWEESPFGQVLRTYRNGYVSFPAPQDILAKPGTATFWIRRDQTKWDRKPWPWNISDQIIVGVLRGLLYIGSDARETNALDLMILKDNLWTRLYDHRAWEMVAVKSTATAWREGQWHHVAVVWNRFDLTVFINGEQVGHDDRLALPNGGQTTIHLGWRPTNRYGQADYHDLRIFRSALPPHRIKRIYESTCP